MIKKIVSLSLCFLFLIAFSHAQDSAEPIVIGHKHAIQSKILDQERPLWVYLPDGYENSEQAYPVMYLLDGTTNFHHTTACVQVLSKQKRMPEMIVVGIPNTDDRTRDLTPPILTGGDDFPNAGGADNLLKFMKEELFPWVNENYRTKDYKMLVGHSFGGLFVTHTLIHYPGIFNSYISISPSLWWDKQNLVLKQTDDFFKNQKDLTGHFYMTMGNEDGTMLGGAWKLAALLKEKGPRNLYWQFDRMPEETHGTIPHPSTYKGLEYVFEKWNKEKWQEAFASGGIDEIKSFEKITQKLYGLSAKWEEHELVRLGKSIADKDNVAKALPIFEKATKLFPESKQVLFQYGQSLVKSGQKKEGIKALKQVLVLDSENLQAAVALKRLGEKVSQVPNVKLSKKVLESYVGEYYFEFGVLVTITSDGKQLWGKSDETLEEKEALIPLGEHRFFVPSENTTIKFRFTDDNVTGMEAGTPNGTFNGKKKTD